MVCAIAPAGIMASSIGRASAAPAPRNNVLRDRCFFVINIALALCLIVVVILLLFIRITSGRPLPSFPRKRESGDSGFPHSRMTTVPEALLQFRCRNRSACGDLVGRRALHAELLARDDFHDERREFPVVARGF